MDEERLTALEGFLDVYGGGFLRNVTSDGTCQVCSAPVQNSDFCIPCGKARQSGYELATRVTSLVYAQGPQNSDQTYKVMRGYKSLTPNPRDLLFVSLLLENALKRHSRCLMATAVVEKPFLWATVPSTSRPGSQHPLNKIVRQLTRNPGAEVEVRTVEGRNDYRIVNPANFEVAVDLSGEHVLVIDDSWVTGARAQSVAGALVLAGAREVSVLTVARVLRPDWEPNVPVIKLLRTAKFDLNTCPWSFEDCSTSRMEPQEELDG